MFHSGMHANFFNKSDMILNYIERILRARVYDVAIETPLDVAPILSKRLNNKVYIKREDLQPVFSFIATMARPSDGC